MRPTHSPKRTITLVPCVSAKLPPPTSSDASTEPLSMEGKQAPSMRTWIRSHLLFSFSLGAALWVCFLYSGALSAPFIYDDPDEIINNTALHTWHLVYSHFVLASVPFTSNFLGSGGSTYRPVFWISLATDWHFWGTNASGFHFTNLLLHWLNGVLLFLLLRRYKLSPTLTVLVPLIWLGLPVNSEAVAWIGARAYLLSTAFLLLALLAATSYVRTKHWPSLAAFTACALLADFSHEQGALLVVLLALCFLLQQRAVLKRWLALGVIALLADLIYALSKFAASPHSVQGSRRLWAVGLEFWQYLQLIVAPIHMSMERSSAMPADSPSLAALLAWAALVAAAVTVALVRRRVPVFAAGLALLLIALLPYCGFVYIYQGMAERFVYLSSIGFVVAIVAVCLSTNPPLRRILLVCLTAWTTWGAWRLITRVEDWQQPIALYQHSLQATPRSATLQDNLGVALRDIGDQDGALQAFQRALQLKPDYPAAIKATADIYAAQGKYQQAIAAYIRSLALAPNDPKTTVNYAAALQQSGNKIEAEQQYRRVIALLPHDSAAYVDLESLYIEQGRLNDAIAVYKQAIAVNPNDSNAYFDMGVMFQERGQNQDALVFYNKVLQLKPGDPQTLLYLGRLQNSQ